MDRVGASPRRERILVAAEREFSAGGLAGGRVARIATIAHVNKQLVFHYFGSKAGLYDAVVQRVAGRFDLDANPGLTPSERLRHLAEELARASEQHATLLTAGWRRRAVEQAAAILRGAQAHGYVRDAVDPVIVSEVIVAAALGWHAMAGGDPSGRRPEPRSAYCATLVAMVTDYCAWR
jgi:AcrR family transcriptional regulator